MSGLKAYVAPLVASCALLLLVSLLRHSGRVPDWAYSSLAIVALALPWVVAFALAFAGTISVKWRGVEVATKRANEAAADVWKIADILMDQVVRYNTIRNVGDMLLTPGELLGLRDQLAAALREAGRSDDEVNRRVVWPMTWEALHDESTDLLRLACEKSKGVVALFHPMRNGPLRSPEAIEADIQRAELDDADVHRRLAEYRKRYMVEKVKLPPTAQ